jgi:hypothetical protein
MSAVQLAKARLVPDGGTPIDVQFNPVSLSYEVSNSLDQQNRDATRRQIVTASNARLSLELQFDSTTSGESVREMTLPIKRLLRPDEADTQATYDIVPPVVRFEWGNFVFSGLIESYRESLDFFSPEGVPLRALVSIAMTHQTRATEPPAPATTRRRPPAPPPATLGRCTPQGVDGAAGVAFGQGFGIGYMAGSMSQAMRSIARANGETSLRRSDRSALAVPQQGGGIGSALGGAVGGGRGSSSAADVGQRTPLSQRLRFDN